METSPRLIAISGPHAGECFELDEPVRSIGRGPDNDIQLRAAWASRRHCTVKRQNGRLMAYDLGSRHGTFVNGEAIDRRELQDGDLLAICDTTFRVLTGDRPRTIAEDPFADGYDAELTDETSLPEAQGLYFRPEALLAESRSESIQAGRLLLRIGLDLAQIRDLSTLADRVLPIALDLAPGDRAAMILQEPGTDEVRVLYAFAQDGAYSSPGGISRTVTQRVLGGREAVLSNQIRETPLDSSKSLRTSGVKALLAVPLLSAEQGPLGVLYLDSYSSERPFSNEHMRLLTALAGLLAPLVLSLRHLEWVESERLRLQSAELDHEIIGQSEAIHDVLSLIGRVAPTESTVLLRGESGTGKELAARAIHRSSSRADRPFLAINCGAVTPTLVESELFGHEKGAFTGADARKIGKLERAHEGTLFLDEVGELPPSAQVKLLRVLQEREYERVGGTTTIQADIRLIAATNRDLERAIRDGGFREDLFFRLNVISITLPPLRERPGDIALLAHHFAAVHSERLQRRPMKISKAAASMLEAYSWPGNVRELSNAIERAVVLGADDTILPEDLPETLGESAREQPLGRYQDVIRDTKKQLIRDAHAAAKGRYATAARFLGLSPNYLHRLIRNLDLKDELEEQTPS